MMLAIPARRSSRRPPQQQTHNVIQVMPPRRGLNTVDIVADMAPDDAIEMDNVLPIDGGVTLREGWREYATNIGGAAPLLSVRTVMSYEGAPANASLSPLSQSQLFAATDTGIFDIEGGGNMAAVARDIALTGTTYAGRMSYVMFTNDAGQFLVACSETDGAFIYNGVTWTKMTLGGAGSGVGVVSGVDPAKWVYVIAWKKRLLFLERASSRMWYLGTGLLGGVAGQFDFGPLMQHGGFAVAMANWTQEAGEGMDDRLVVVGSSGDLAVYEGTDPGDASKFGNVGVWFIGRPPVGRRCVTTTGGNVYVLTQYGVVPVSQVLQGGLDNILTSDTDVLKQLRKIQGQLFYDFNILLDQMGWEITVLPTKALIHITRPTIAVNDFSQYVFQLHNLAWSRFLDVPAGTFSARLNHVYAGTDDGRVLRVLDGSTDGKKIDGTGGAEIRGRITPAFNYLGDPTTEKQMLMVWVNFLSTSAPGFKVHVNSNFTLDSIMRSAVAAKTTGSLWDGSYWEKAVWSGGRGHFSEWRSAEGLGVAMTASIAFSAELPTTLASIKYMVKAGAPWS